MFKKFLSIIVILFFIALIANATVVTKGAYEGLYLWINAVIPALVPYMFASEIIIRYELYAGINFIFKPFARLLKISERSCFGIFCGLFFGFPMCANAAIDMYNKNQISKGEANFLICSFNNLSPAFIGAYISITILNNKYKIWLIFLLVYIIILMLSIFNRYVLFNKIPSSKSLLTEVSTQENRNLTLFISVLIKISTIGCLIIIFSVCIEVIKHYLPPYLQIACAFLEVTRGSLLISDNAPLVLAVCMSGGICGLFQTIALDTKHIINISKYILAKAIASAVTYVACYFIL